MVRYLKPLALGAVLLAANAFAYKDFTHRALTHWSFITTIPGVGPVSFSTDPALRAAGMVSGVNTVVGGFSLVEWAEQGCVDEDYFGGPTRVKDHFHDPLNDRGLTGVLGIGAGVSSAVWAWKTDDGYGWLPAKNQYYRMLTLPTLSARQTAARKMMANLGHVVHLLQDAAQPQHTRNDWHINYAGYGEPSQFEDYCDQHFGDYDSIPTSYGFFPLLYPPTSLGAAETAAGMTPEFRSFWDTDMYTWSGLTNPYAMPYIGLAELSNMVGITDDAGFMDETSAVLNYPSGFTAILSDMPNSVGYRYPNPRLINTDLDNVIWLATSAHSAAISYPLSGLETATPTADPGSYYDCALESPMLLNDWFSLKKEYSPTLGWHAKPYLTDTNRDAQARFFLAAAVGYCNGLVQHFFRMSLFTTVAQATHSDDRTRLDVRVDTGFPSEDDAPVNGKWQLFQEANDGDRTPATFQKSKTRTGGKLFLYPKKTSYYGIAYRVDRVGYSALPNNDFDLAGERLKLVLKRLDTSIIADQGNAGCTITVNGATYNAQYASFLSKPDDQPYFYFAGTPGNVTFTGNAEDYTFKIKGGGSWYDQANPDNGWYASGTATFKVHNAQGSGQDTVSISFSGKTLEGAGKSWSGETTASNHLASIAEFEEG